MKFNRPKAMMPLRGSSLLFTSKFSGVTDTHSDYLSVIKNHASSLIPIKTLGSYPSLEILSSFLLNLNISPWLGKIFWNLWCLDYQKMNFWLKKLKIYFFTHALSQNYPKGHITSPRFILDLDRFFFVFFSFLKNFNIASRLGGFHPQFVQYLLK